MLVSVPPGTVDTTTREAAGPLGVGTLREKEARLVEALALADGGLVTRERLLVEVFGHAPASTSRTVDATMGRLRLALSAVGLPADAIQTVYGEGYRLLANPVATAPRASNLIGRTLEQEQLQGLLTDASARLVTVVGLGGVGKTTLVRALTDHRPDALFVDLSDATHGDDLDPLLRTALGCDHDEAPIDALARRGPTLLVLDNVEQVVYAVRQRVPALLGISALRIWSTSQVPLRVDGEQLVPLGPLEADDAAALFARQAEGVRPLRPEEGDALAPLLGALDHHPLSIELAAGRLRVMTVADLRERLADASRWLRGREGPARHRSVDSAMRRTLGLLPADVLAGAAQLAVLPREVSLRRVEQCVDVAGAWAADLLEELVDHGLVVHHPDARGRPRFRLHNAVRAVVDREAVESGVHRRWVAHVRADLEEGEHPPDPSELEACAGVALRHGAHDEAARMLGALTRHGGLSTDRRRLLPLLAQLDEASLSPEAGCAKLTAEAFVALGDDPAQASILADRAVALAEGEPSLWACDALKQRAEARSYTGDLGGCHADLEEMAGQMRRLGRAGGDLQAGLGIALASFRAGHDRDAWAALERVALLSEGAPASSRLQFLQLRFWVALELGEGQVAEEVFPALAARAQEGSDATRGWAELAGSTLAYQQGDLAEAVTSAQRGVRLARDAWLTTLLLTNRGWFHLAAWQWPASQAAMAEALSVGVRGGRRAAELAHHTLAQWHQVRGDLAAGADHLREAAVLRSGARLTEGQRALALAQGGDVSGALSLQQQRCMALRDDERGRSRVAALEDLAQLQLAVGDFDGAEASCRRLLADPCLGTLQRLSVEAALRAATAQPHPAGSGSWGGTSQGLAASTWEGLALRRADRGAEGEAILDAVEAACRDAGLPTTAEHRWRVTVARSV